MLEQKYNETLRVGVVGLGLIGGSLAKALKEYTNHQVFGGDISKSVILAAKMTNTIDEELTEQALETCDILLLSLYPQSTVDYVKANASHIKRDCIVIDCGGVKRFVCDELLPVANAHGFTFIGGHPMAGTQFWGFSHARASLFKGASMILAPREINDIVLLERLKYFFVSLGFEKLTITTPEDHDRIIAYTSQLAHIVSNAYIKSPTALQRKGFSAGSFKDMTRVAKLNVPMWTELFLENGDYLSQEIDLLIEHLRQLGDAIKSEDAETLSALLADGVETKKKTIN